MLEDLPSNRGMIANPEECWNAPWFVFSCRRLQPSLEAKASPGPEPVDPKRECPKVRGTLFWGPYSKAPTI